MLTVIVPAHNESGRLERNARKILEAAGRDCQLIIAEDGSTDGTAEEGMRLAESDSRVSFQHFDRRQGRGRALKEASGLVKGDKVIYMDADLSTDISHIREMLMLLDGNDIVVGSRYAKGARARRARRRLLLSRAYLMLVRLFFPKLGIRDTECGFKGFRKDVFLDLCGKVRSGGWSWDLEMLVRARRSGYSIREMPVRWEEGETTTINMFRDSLSQFAGILRARLS